MMSVSGSRFGSCGTFWAVFRSCLGGVVVLGPFSGQLHISCNLVWKLTGNNDSYLQPYM